MAEKWFRANYQPVLPMGRDGRLVTASEEHIRISKDAALEGMVLLKNERTGSGRKALPLEYGARIALFGKGTVDYVKGGGGSGDVTVPYIRNLADGFSLLGDRVQVFDGTVPFYEKFVREQYENGYMPGMVHEPELPDELLHRAAAFADTAVISVSRFSGEGWDRKSALDGIADHKEVDRTAVRLSNEIFERGDFYLSAAEERMVEKVKNAFGRVIVVLNTGGVTDVSWIADDDRIQGALHAWQGGIEGGLAAAQLLCGIASPSGRLADTFARDLADYPSTQNFYESDDYVDYTDDIYVGYRYFETIPGAAGKVIYPFGYGLSYTTFKLSGLQVQADEKEIRVSVLVCNTGRAAGKEVVQVYYSAPQGLLGKPARELAGYQKTRLLEPGETQLVTVCFVTDSMASYDDLGKVCKSAWVLEKGSYHFYVGTSVRDTAESETVLTLDGNRIVRQLTERMAPSKLEKRMLSDGSFEQLPAGEAHDPDENALTPMPQDEMALPTPRVRAQAGRSFFLQPEPGDRQLREVAEGTLSMEDFMAQLSDEDLAWLLGGKPNTGVANTFGYGGCARLGIPSIMSADGPAGLRVWEQTGVKTTAFPVGTLLACTWDPQVTEAVGRAGGEEVKENNIGVWLTPAINIHRNPLCGRNFEYYSEDPYLTAKQAGGMVRGIQSNHIGATVKHLALNNKETNRKNCDSRCSERAAREIYLKAFELIVKEEDPWSIMTSYNIINGHRASTDADLLGGILRGEWGYEGMVTTDWWTYAEQYREVLAGNDVKMGVGYPDRLMEALEKGLITREDMEKCAKRILNLILKID